MSKKILSIEGGGIRGVIPAYICMKIEEGRVSNRLARQGDFFSDKLHILYSNLSGNLKNNPGLVQELSDKKEGVISRFTKLDTSTGTLFHRDSSHNR